VLALSHEEVVTTHVAQLVRSYRQLPLCLYHFQVKERDEPRPRAGVLRTREFVMKDAYTFDRDRDGLDEAYDRQFAAYTRIYERCGLEFYPCEADVGNMGGFGAHEFMAPCAAGEDDVVLAPGYVANLEVASADPQGAGEPLRDDLSGVLETPGLTTIEAVAGSLGVAPARLLKAFPVVTESRGVVTVFLRGDHRVNEIKLRTALGEDFRPARPEELPGPAGFLGPADGAAVLYDAAVAPGRYVAGANEPDRHRVVEVPAGERLDVRAVVAGDTVHGNAVRIEPAIEIGNIFKLGTRYSDPLGATYLDEQGKEHPIVMGCYGIGPARIAAAAVEQLGDEGGIPWPKAIAPYDVAVVPLGKPGGDEQAAGEALYDQLRAAGLDAVLDDRPAKPGEKFADADLLGCPLRLTIGGRGLASGEIEALARRGREQLEPVPLSDPVEAVRERWHGLA
jgi:prolyl-tRNA synthetase